MSRRNGPTLRASRLTGIELRYRGGTVQLRTRGGMSRRSARDLSGGEQLFVNPPILAPYQRGRCKSRRPGRALRRSRSQQGQDGYSFYQCRVEVVPTIEGDPESISKDLQHQCPWSLRYRSEGSSHLNDGASIVINGSGVWVEGFPAYGTGRKPVVLRPEAV